MQLATMIPNDDGICNIYRHATYGAGMIPRDPKGGLAFSIILNEPAVAYTREAYEHCIIMLSGSFNDQ